jgi:hypothetical protein
VDRDQHLAHIAIMFRHTRQIMVMEATMVSAARTRSAQNSSDIRTGAI